MLSKKLHRNLEVGLNRPIFLYSNEITLTLESSLLFVILVLFCIKGGVILAPPLFFKKIV
jgi:hypothetical protein